MRQILGAVILTGACVVLPGLVRADDQAATAVLDRAINAMGGAEKLGKAETFSWKARGRLMINGGENDFNTHVTIKGLDHLRRKFENDQFKMTIVLNGDRGWRRVREVNRVIEGEVLSSEKRSTYLQIVPITLVPLKGKGFTYQAAADEKVGDKPAAALKATGPDGKEFTLYFDKDSGLPVKEVARMSDLQGNEFTIEVAYTDYKDFGGIKKATKMEVKRDGAISQVVEVTEFKVLSQVDPETFAEPK